MLWRRSLVQPISIGEALLLVALLAFCLVLPVFLAPACCVILLLVLDRLGLTLLGRWTVILGLLTASWAVWKLGIGLGG